MPNICRNDVILSGPTEVLALVGAAIRTTGEGEDKTTDFWFGDLLPIPEDFEACRGWNTEEADKLLAYAERGEKDKEFVELTARYLTYKWIQELGLQTPEDVAAHLIQDCLKKNGRTLVELGQARRTCREKYGAPDSYYWCIKNWGTKSIGWDAEIHEEGDTLRIQFDTAWCPPSGILAYLANTLGLTVDHCYVFEFQGAGRQFPGENEYVIWRDETMSERQKHYVASRCFDDVHTLPDAI